jgi:hypothetical protein
MKIPRLFTASLALAFAPVLAGPLCNPVRAQEAAAPAVALDSVYGLAARLPKDTEGFASLYRLRPLVEDFLKSNIVKKIKNHEQIARELELDDIERALDDPQFRQYVELAAEALGNELTIAVPAGFSEKFAALIKAAPMLQAGFFMARAVNIGPNGEAQPSGPPKELLPIIESMAALEMPPVILALNAGKQKEMLQALIGQGLNELPGEVTDKLESGKFEAGGVSFDSFTLRVGKLLDDDDKRDMESDLGKAYGDEEKGKALAKKLQSKSVEIAWGWLDSHLILSIGPDHSHVKFVSAADSVLTHPDVAARAAQVAAKNPIGFTYTSQQAQRTLAAAGGFFDTLLSLADMAKKAGAPVNLDNVTKELQALDAKADALWPNDAVASVGAIWWDGGLNAEAWGGAKMRGLDSSKPLTFPSLASDKTFLLLAGRSDMAFSDKVWKFIEDTGVSIFSIYEKDVKGMMPDDVRQGAALGEAFGLPMVKELWKAVVNFRASLGAEAAILVNLDGAMPAIPGSPIPPDVVAKGRIPRVAWVSELKDRAKLTEAWGGVKSLLTNAAAIVAAQTGTNIKTEPVTKKEGDVELYGFELPMDLGDVWPHAAATASQYYLSSSPSFTKELAAKAPSAVSPALGLKAQVNFPALWIFADHWARLIPAGPEESEMIEFALTLARAVGSLDVQAGEEAGQSHSKLRWTLKDIE